MYVRGSIYSTKLDSVETILKYREPTPQPIAATATPPTLPTSRYWFDHCWAHCAQSGIEVNLYYYPLTPPDILATHFFLFPTSPLPQYYFRPQFYSHANHSKFFSVWIFIFLQLPLPYSPSIHNFITLKKWGNGGPEDWWKTRGLGLGDWQGTDNRTRPGAQQEGQHPEMQMQHFKV